jgi:hypothetical protein
VTSALVTWIAFRAPRNGNSWAQAELEPIR